MRILHGVTGEGLGHTMRARTLARELERRGHIVKMAASGRAVDVLRGHGLDVVAIDGLELAYGDSGLLRARTVLSNLRHAPRALARNVDVALSAIAAFDPDGAITDFDSFAWAVGRVLGIPVVSFDHQHILDRFRHPDDVLRTTSLGFAATRAVVRAKTPGCDHFVVTSFFFPEPRRERASTTTLVGPVMRPEIEAAERDRGRPTGDAVLVYQTRDLGRDPSLLPALERLRGTRFVVYGSRGATCDVARGNVVVRAFDERRFVADLAGARAVITNGGFTTIAEALFLGKPVLSIPVARQAEQELNAAWLERIGAGARAERGSFGVLRSFLARVERGDFDNVQDARFFRGTVDACEAIERELAA